jgi:hypothetical protein
MVEVRGSSEKGNARILQLLKMPDGRLSVWIHSADSKKNGWEIYVQPDELIEKLKLAGVQIG